MNQQKIKQTVSNLVAFALQKGLIEQQDALFCQNALCELLRIDADCSVSCSDQYHSATVLLEEICDYAVHTGLIEQDTPTLRILFDTRVMGIFMQRPSDITSTFYQKMLKEGVQAATDWFYALCQDVNYIRTDDIAKNMMWQANPYVVTINLSKPEKDPKEIAMLKDAKASEYPACLLCIENCGHPGSLTQPARQTLRQIPMHLAEEEWYFQYSPYVYYREHCIVLAKEHTPMCTSHKTFERLLSFVTAFPHYFLGSNAGLPIVGGSILNHDHYQGGRADLPMSMAKIKRTYKSIKYQGISMHLLDWPVPCLRLVGDDPSILAIAANDMFITWQGYSDLDCQIISHTDETPHNAVTPISRIRNGQYELDIVLRNNRTNDSHPMGIFHPHEDLHHIKKENIGLIEIMGLFILPGRLKEMLTNAVEYLTGQKEYEEQILAPHMSWLNEIQSNLNSHISADDALQRLQDEIGSVCHRVLQDVAVFKDNEQGQAGLKRFIEHCEYVD